MKFKLKNGMEVDLHEEDIMAISKMKGGDFAEMTEYFEDLHKHAMSKMEMISECIITDEDSIDKAAEYVAKNGTYMDFVKFIRYEMDANVAYHTLQSTK
jgi:hypothetical protein